MPMPWLKLVFQAFGTMVGTIGGPAGVWVGSLLGGLAGGFVERAFMDFPDVPSLDGIRLQSSGYSVPIPQLFGTMRMAGNVIWAVPIREEDIKDRASKGGGKTVVVGHNYYGTFAIGICRGPIASVVRIWADTKLIFDLDATHGAKYYRIKGEDSWHEVENDDDENDVVAIAGLKWTLYLGDETQVADPLIESYEGAGAVPGFRGLAYMVFEDFPVSDFGQRIPIFTFEVTTSSIESVPVKPLEDVPTSIWGSDNVVADPDGVHVWFEASGLWWKVDVVQHELTFYKDTSDALIPQQSAAMGNSFDVDERGFIYTSQQTDGSSTGRIIKINPESFSIERGTWSEPLFSGEPGVVFNQIVVSKNPDYPYVFARTNNQVYWWWRDDPAEGEGEIRVRVPYPNIVWIHYDSAFSRLFILETTGYLHVTVLGGPDVNIPGGSYDLSTWISDPDLVTYDLGSNTIIVGSDTDNRIAFFRGINIADSDRGFLGELTSSDHIDIFGTYNTAYWNQGPVNGFLYCSGGITPTQSDLYRINVSARTVDKAYTFEYAGGVIPFGSGVYNAITHSVIQSMNGPGLRIGKAKLDRVTPAGMPLSEIVEDLCVQAGLTEYQIDTDSLVGLSAGDPITVRGFVLDSRMPARNALELLMRTFFFDATESDGMVKFVKRGADSVVTITEDKLAAHKGGDNRPAELVSTRVHELDLPQQLDVSYVSKQLDYDAALQIARRLQTRSEAKRTIVTPIVLTPDEAMKVAVGQLYAAWVGRVSHAFSVSREFAYLDATDVVVVQEGGNSHTVRIHKIDYQGPALQIEAVNEEAAVYDYTGVGSDLPGGEQFVGWPGLTKLVLFDIPMLDIGQNVPGLYFATVATTQNWRGADVMKSVDNGATWFNWAGSTRDAVAGFADDALGDVTDPFIWDEGNSVTLWLYDETDALTSATEAAVLDGTNAAILGDEVIGFRAATQNSNGSWTLSGLMRGRRGSDYATGGHVAGDHFVLIDLTKMRFEGVALEEEGVATLYRAVSIGMQFNDAANVEKTIYIRNMKPLSPQHVAAVEEDNGDITMTWIRRARMSGEWRDNVGVPIGETSEAYEVDMAYQGVIFRTLAVTAETATYTAADQATDGIFSLTMTVTVYQISTIIGRGFASEAVSHVIP